MRLVHPLRSATLRLLSHVTLALLLGNLLAACSDGAEDAMQAAAAAQLQLDSGDVVGARKAINEAINARDDIIDLQLLRGRIELASGSRSRAFAAYSDALALDPTNLEALQGVSQLGLSTGHLEASREATDRILTLVPDQPDALIVRGIHGLIRRRYDEAIGDAEKVLAANPGNQNAAILKARSLFLKRDPEGALAAVGKFRDEDAGVSLTRLEIFRELRRPEGMQQQFARLRVARPEDFALRLDEANLEFKLGRRATAHRLVAATLANPKASEEIVRQAISLWTEYGCDDLDLSLVESVARNGSGYARQATASYFLERNELGQARSLIASFKADEQRPLVSRLLAKEGKLPQAVALASSVLARDRTDCDALLTLSDASLSLRQPAASLRSAQQATAECPASRPAWLAAARAYQALGRDDGVARVYSESVEANPQDSPLTSNFANWLLKEGRSREAIAISRRLTNYAPALLSGWRLYQDLCKRTKSDCEAAAMTGLKDASTRFGVDLEVGKMPPNGLFGRFTAR